MKYIDDARWTNGFNTSTELGRDYFIAGMEYLANRYSKGNKGLICNYVIGNEIDYAYDWNEVIPNDSKDGKPLPARGEKNLRPGEIETTVSLDTFMEEYSRALRLANLAVKKYSSDISVGISISKEWTQSRRDQGNLKPDTNKRYDSYRPKELVEWLNYYSKKRGDYDWTITPHNYPLTQSGNAAAYETGLESESGTAMITGDPDTTVRISQNNMEVMQLFLDRKYNLYNGKCREIYLTENGCSTGSDIGTPSAKLQKEQAAAVAQLYYRAASLPSVKAIIYYKIADREAEGATSFKLGLKDTTGAKKLSYDVWKYIDTNRSFDVSKKYLSGISFKKNGKVYSTEEGNLKSFRDVMEVVDSDFDWDAHWDEKALTPVTIEEETDERSLKTDKTEYGADDPILVTARGNSSDLVGIYKKGETPEAEPIYSYEVGGDNNGVKHKSGKQYDIRAYGAVNEARRDDAKLPAGDYSIILSAGDEVLQKVDITITGTSEFDEGKKVATNKTTYSVGEDILVTASGEGKDWVGIYLKGEVPSGTVNSFYWFYVSDATHVSGKPGIIQNGLSNNRATVLPAGQYEVVLLADDGYTEIARTQPITIEASSESSDNTLTSVEYTLKNNTDGFANGTVTITKPEDSDSTDCLMYWGDENGKPLEGYSHLAKFRLSGKTTTHNMQPNTIIPPGAKTLLAYGVAGGSQASECVMTTLPEGAAYTFDSDSNVTTRFSVMSDLHLVTEGSGNDFNENTNYHFTDALKDVVKNLPGASGVFVNGDIADHGKASEYKVCMNLLKSVNGAPDMHMAIGNHDWRTGNPDSQFQKYANWLNPAVEPEELYYDEWVEGYHFIYLAGEAMGEVAIISDEQFEWFENLLEEDSMKDQSKPIFVFLHEGLQDSMAGNYAGQWGYSYGVAQDARLKKIVQKYGQVIMFGGHTHYELNTENSVTPGSEEFPVYVNTSAVGYLWDAYNTPAGEYMYGAQGYFTKVFNDKIYMFGRDFITQEFIPSAMYVIEPSELTIAKSKISMSVGDKPVNVGAKTEDGMELTYSTSNPKVAKVDYQGNVRAVASGTAKIYISTESSDTKTINRKIVTVTVK